MWEIEVLYDEDLEVLMYIMSALLSQQILVNIYITLQTYRNQIFFFNIKLYWLGAEGENVEVILGWLF